MSNLIPFTIVWFLYEGWQRIKNFFFPFFFGGFVLADFWVLFVHFVCLVD